MSERRESYITTTVPIGEIVSPPFEIETWERNMLLRMRQAAQTGQMLLVDGDARCWFVLGRMECNKEQRQELPFKI